MTDIFEYFGDDPLDQKMIRLMEFYQKSIDPYHKTLLTLLSMFRSPIGQITISQLFSGIFYHLQQEKLEEDEIGQKIRFAVGKLNASGLLIRDHLNGNEVYACHPVIRDYFRNNVLANQSSTTLFAANILSSRPDEIGLVGVSSIEAFLVAIELLLQTGVQAHFLEAEELFSQRLNKGQALIGTGLANEGKRCYQAFVKCLSSHTFSAYNRNLDRSYFERGLMQFYFQLGEYEEALKLADMAVIKVLSFKKAVVLRVMASTNYRIGKFEGALINCNSAIDIEKKQLTPNNGCAEGLAISYYRKAVCLLSVGLTKDAKKVIGEVGAIHDYLDTAYSDSLLYEILANLKMAMYENDVKGIRRFIQRSESCMKNIQNHFLSLEATLMIAHGNLLIKELAKTKKLAETIRQTALKNSLPYEHCYASYLIESAKLMMGELIKPPVIRQLVEQARAGGTSPLQIQAAALLNSVETSDEIEQIWLEAENLSDRIGYRLLEV